MFVCEAVSAQSVETMLDLTALSLREGVLTK
jgi:hypothetical protein